MKTLKQIVIYSTAVFAAAIVFGFFLFADHTTRAAADANPKAEGIVVLTGGGQRLRVAGKLLKDRHAKRLLISGVNRIVNRAKLRRLLDIDNRLFRCCVDIDYAAQNTRGNAVETRKWVRKHEFQSIIVVTSSYHMPRSLSELGRVLPAVDLVAHPVVPARFRDAPWWLDHRNIMLLGAEYLKYLPSVAQFGVGRIMETPKSTTSKPVHKAVAVQ